MPSEAIGVDTDMVHSALAVRAVSGQEWVRSLVRPDTGLLASAHMVATLRSAVAETIWPCYPLCVVATERLGIMRDSVLQWAVLEGALGCFAEIARATTDLTLRAQLRLCIVMPTGGQLKKFVTGSENGEKLSDRYIKRPDQENEAEAYALMQFARCRRAYMLGEISREAPGEWTAYQVEAACKDLWSSARTGKLQALDVSAADVLAVADKFARGPEYTHISEEVGW
jgi:hypothetical protein